tara:strand:+ start:789 stop:2048 length:1260 start_codon:yes stop_codon:yes gene_type:complete
MKTKYCLAYVAALYTLLTFVDISASADEIITQQKVFNKLDTSLSPALNEQGVFTLDSEILSLKTLSEHDKATAQVKLLALQASGLLLNQAEQYLLYIVHANIANVEGQENKVINWLNKAIKLEPSLAKKQLDTPLFAGAYLTLASIYERQRATQKAFDSKKIYIEKYFSYLEQQKELRVKRLDEKYDIERKHEKNQLLTQNNQLKRYALALAQSAQREQYRNIAIFLAASIIFFVLLLRQFKIRRALKSLAKTDSLTLLANRRAFFDNGYIYMERALLANSELSVLMLDIDHFKKVNDSFGHDVGDKVICHVAALASETMRSRDFLARIGGEEFAAILPDANIEQARAIAERIREKIQDHSNEHRVNDIQTTVSIGLASINDVRESFDSLLHAADMAMYQAKANGRNQVFSYISESKKK